MIICSFSEFKQEVHEAPRKLKGKKLHRWLLNCLSNRTTITDWELTENMKICKTILYLERIGKIKLGSKNLGYPYISVEVI